MENARLSMLTFPFVRPGSLGSVARSAAAPRLPVGVRAFSVAASRAPGSTSSGGEASQCSVLTHLLVRYKGLTAPRSPPGSSEPSTSLIPFVQQSRALSTSSKSSAAPNYGASEMVSPASTGNVIPQPADVSQLAQKGSNQLSLETPRNGMEYVLCKSKLPRSVDEDYVLAA